MKVVEILNEAKQPAKKKKKIPKPKPRPKKNLWFQDKNHWHNDLTFVHGHGIEIYHPEGEEDEEARDYYATSPGGQITWGVWRGKHKRGITFHQPRHISVVKHPRVKLKQLDTSGAPTNNITNPPVP